MFFVLTNLRPIKILCIKSEFLTEMELHPPLNRSKFKAFRSTIIPSKYSEQLYFFKYILMIFPKSPLVIVWLGSIVEF